MTSTAARPAPTLRRRIDAQLLRWQARLEGEFADRVLPWVAASVLTIMFFVLAEARVRSLDAGTDLAAAMQGMWLISHGHGANLTITGTQLLAEHLPIGMYPVAYLTRITPVAPTLLLLQSAGIAFGVVPLWRIVRRVADLRVGAALAITIAYGASPTLNNFMLDDFHAVAIAVAPLLGATYLALRGKHWGQFALLSIVVVIWSAELALVIAGLGLLIFMRGHRKHGVRTMIAGVGYIVLAVLVLEPRLGSTGFIAPGAFKAYGASAFSITWGMFIHPHKVLGDLLAQENIRFLIELFAPLLFLPVLAPRYLLPALPLTGLYLIADVPVRATFANEFGLPLTVFAFVAATFALARIGRRSIERIVVDRRVLIALVVASIGFWCIDAQNSLYDRPWNWGREDVADAARHNAAESVPNTSFGVLASPVILPLVAERQRAYVLNSPNIVIGNDVTYVILDTNTSGWNDTETRTFEETVVGRGFAVLSTAQGVATFVRR